MKRFTISVRGGWWWGLVGPTEGVTGVSNRRPGRPGPGLGSGEEGGVGRVPVKSRHFPFIKALSRTPSWVRSPRFTRL